MIDLSEFLKAAGSFITFVGILFLMHRAFKLTSKDKGGSNNNSDSSNK